jgi:hypothetical protein
MSALSLAEPASTEPNLASHRNQDAVFFPTVHLFLIYGVMLV